MSLSIPIPKTLIVGSPKLEQRESTAARFVGAGKIFSTLPSILLLNLTRVL